MIELRPARRDDVPACIALERHVTSHPWTEAVFLSCFSERYFPVVAECEQQLVGFYVGEAVAGEVTLFNIAVASAWQGKGIGQRLLEHFMMQGRARGATDFFLEVRASNQRAIELYDRAGFHQIGRRPGYYPTAQGMEDAVLMAKTELFGD